MAERKFSVNPKELSKSNRLNDKKKQALQMFAEASKEFVSKKLYFDLLEKLTTHRRFAMNLDSAADAQARVIRPIIKKSVAEGKDQPKKVHFKDIPEEKSEVVAKEVKKVSPKKAKKSLLKPPSEEELSNELQKKLANVLTRVEDFIKTEEKDTGKKVQIKKPETKPISTLSPLDRVNITRFIHQDILSDIISQVFLYGESLIISKEIQAKYENRPVPKHVFSLFHEFQYPIAESLPHSLQCVGSLGRILYMESLGYLQQIDVMTEKSLSPYFLGIRMPLRYTPIIDTIIDSKSCRIYTLNNLWKLEVWSLEQSSSLPIKRVPMVNCKVEPDCIEQAYKSRYKKSKPTFLSITESANQILVVNTSCVDGNIVFVDPISLSILKRIHFVFSDYEVSSSIKNAIDRLITCLALDLKSTSEVITFLKSFPRTASFHYSEFVDKMRAKAPNADSNTRSFPA